MNGNNLHCDEGIVDLCKKDCGCLEANGFCAFRKDYIHDAWKLMPVNYTMHFIDECSDENAPFKILTLTKKKSAVKFECTEWIFTSLDSTMQFLEEH